MVFFEGSDPKVLESFMLLKKMQFSIVKAINDEIDSMLFNNNWVLMNLHLALKLIGCEWVLE